MLKLRLSRALAFAGAVVIGIAAAASGQARATPVAAAPATDELLAEVRAIRAEINQAAGTSLRAQLLVARLQLQEQRINTVARQLAEVQERLANTERGLLPMTAQLKNALEEPPPEVSAEQRREVELHRQLLKGQLEQMRRVEQELRGQEASLTAHLAESQSRWSEFNERLDELERMLPTRPR